MPKLILASASPYRSAQLRRLGLAFEAVAPEVDEDAFKQEGLSPAELAAELALAKAEAVAARFPAAVVIGGDQVAALGNRVFGKPGTSERAVEQLLALAGQVHQLFAAVAVVKGERAMSAATVCHMGMRTLTRAEAERYVQADQPLARAEAERYVQADQPLDCAGSYKFESRGATLFEYANTPDPTAIEGLPLLGLCMLLRKFGVELP